MSKTNAGRRLVRVNGAEASAASLSEWLAIGWLTAMDGLFMDSAGAGGATWTGSRWLFDLITRAMCHAMKPLYANATSCWTRTARRLARCNPSAVSEHGAAITTNRTALVATLTDELTALPDAPFAKPNLTYLPGGPIEREDFRAELTHPRTRSRSWSYTHRATQRRTGRSYGRQRSGCCVMFHRRAKSILIVLTLAHAVLAAEGRPGVLLLDEVAAHLDPVRRGALFERLRMGRAQVWLTGTGLRPLRIF